MSLVRWNTHWPNTVAHLLDNFLEQDLPLSRSHAPAVNIKEEADHFQLEVAAPGLQKEDFNIDLNKQVLTISAERKEEQTQEEQGKYTRREFSYQAFRRAFNLPDTVDEEAISAKYENGVLYVHLPKRDEAKVKALRQISIS
ncbi:Hsp20/alpha crystallin family protein [Eisenibacter elegans]|uniref:Hsp20/alpha crystallin family protein n=1 Tax=Eisenibacter elegans TaxID=997 RepID=UPI00042A57DF|nr:Hsp20/alpha crystallin family protein [Eisenibacter elegans]